jgi:hypothetical protein
LKKTIEKREESLDVYLDLHNHSAAMALARELKDYDIESRISEYETEVKYEGNE